MKTSAFEPPQRPRHAGWWVAALASSAAAVLIIGVPRASTAPVNVETMDECPIAIPLGLMSPTFPDGHPPWCLEVDVGRWLFSDPVLSRDGTISCATCHRPDYAFADPRPRSIGIGGRLSTRNSPTLLNVAFFDRLSWDGRHGSLEEQALAAIANEDEMGMALDRLPAAAEPTYGTALRRLYGENSPQAIARALAAFQRTLLAGDSPFDRYLYLGQANAISESAKRGFELFLRKGRCIQCHQIRCEECHPFGGSTAFFMNSRFHNLGIGYEAGRTTRVDAGRRRVTGAPADEGAFKTPSLRNAALTAPYMHDGSLATLADVIKHYDGGGHRNPHLDPEIRPLHLGTNERRALVDFLEALTSVGLQRAPDTRF